MGFEGNVSSTIGSFLSNKLSIGELRFTGYNASQGIIAQDEVLRIELYNPLQLSLSDCLANIQIEGVLSTLEEVDFNLVEKSFGLKENKTELIVKPNPNSGNLYWSPQQNLIPSVYITLPESYLVKILLKTKTR